MQSLRVLSEEYRSCDRCSELASTRTQVVFGSQHLQPCSVMIIGEAPGKNEDETGEPFIGRSGELLNGLLKDIGLERSDVFITNTILCRPPGNRNPKKEELTQCRTRLDQTIALIDPTVIITLGNFATQYMLDTKEGITKLRGKVYEQQGRSIIPMPHPATLLYNGLSEELFSLFRRDFQLVKGLLDGRRPPGESQQTL